MPDVKILCSERHTTITKMGFTCFGKLELHCHVHPVLFSFLQRGVIFTAHVVLVFSCEVLSCGHTVLERVSTKTTEKRVDGKPREGGSHTK